MRWFILSVVGVFVLGIAANTTDAQSFRRGPVRPTPNMMSSRAFVPFNSSFVTPLPTVTRSTMGTFNPATGKFTPSLAGPFALSQRHGFEPVAGTFTPSTTGNFVLQTRQTFNPSTGAFVPSTAGNFVARERGNFTPASGSFTNTASGRFNPQTGRFVPNSTGVFSLTSRASFVPSNGFFVPSTSGSFILSAHETFRPSTNSFVPSANGSFLFQTRGNFITANAAAALTSPVTQGGTGVFTSTPSGRQNQLNNPFGFNNAFNPFLTNPARPFNNGFVLNPNIPSVAENRRFLALANSFVASQGVNPFGFNNPFVLSNPFLTNQALAFNNPLLARQLGLWNPWMTNPYLWNPYGAGYFPQAGYGSASYAAPYSSSYPAQSYAAPSYASNASPANYASNISIPAYTPPAGQNKQQPLLGAYGIPNDDGAVKWPLAFRRMSPDDKQTLLDPLESRLQVLTTQAAAGNVNPAILRLAKQNVNELRRWLGTHRTDFATDTLADASEFLHTLDKAISSMQRAY